ncbi:MAG: Rab family GTPase [Candidatus Kariarchaeaceae archaeon]|jgi:small GTP-binding protein
MSARTVFKVILLGDAAVGKTSIRKRYLGEGFKQSYSMTLGADFAIKMIRDDVIQIWDLAGHRFFRTVRDPYYAGANGIILVFDLTRLSSLNNLRIWIEEALRINNKKLPFIIVGNKTDLYDEESLIEVRPVVKELIQDLQAYTPYDIQYIESSAKLGNNIELIFGNLIDIMKIN